MGNGVLLCNYHHHEVHRLDLTVTRHLVGTGRLNATLARVRYEFHDPRGRAVWATTERGARHDASRDPGRGAEPPGGLPAPTSAPGSAATSRPTAARSANEQDQLDFLVA